MRAFLCERFDGKFPVGDEEATALRDSKIKEAKRLRENALQVLNKKRAKLAKLAKTNTMNLPYSAKYPVFAHFSPLMPQTQ